MKSRIFSESHELFRANARAFLERELAPHAARFREQGIVDRELWRKAGSAGLLCPWLEEEHGGPGGDFLHSVVLTEELARIHGLDFSCWLHSDIIAPYIDSFGSTAQKAKWLPAVASGEVVLSVGMTEPGTGSDLAAIRTVARRDGDHYVIDGAKTFITNGILSDLCIVAARTEHATGGRHGNLSLFLVEADRPGFLKQSRLRKIGMHAQDTAELVFEGCRVPSENLLGSEGAGFAMLMEKLARERIVVAICAQASAEQMLVETLRYVREREAFGRPIGKFQNTQFVLADCATEIEVGRAFLDRLIEAHLTGEQLVKEAAMAKLWHTELASRVADRCLQLFGGYGYMEEYPIARAFVDARVPRIYAGTNEIMKTIIAKQLGL